MGLKKHVVLAGLLALFQALSAQAQQFNCDCTVIVGGCEASIKVKPYGSGVSQGAELSFVSTAPICSKVSYYVDSMSYFTILSRGNTGEDSIFGTSPVTRETVSGIKCEVCKRVTDVRPEIGGAQEPPQDRKNEDELQISGNWVDESNARMGYQLTLEGGRIRGQSRDMKGLLPIRDGRITGPKSFEFSFTNWIGQSIVVSCTLTAPGKANCPYRGTFFPGTQVLSKQ